MYPGLMGEKGVGTRGPLPEPLTGGTVTPTITPDIGITTRRGPCMRPRLASYTYRPPLLYTHPYQGLCMGEATWVAGSGYRHPLWGFRFRFTDTNREDSPRAGQPCKFFLRRKGRIRDQERREAHPHEEAVK